MTSPACMRWKPGQRQTWRLPSDGRFDPARYGVTTLTETVAREYVLARHYAGSWPSAVQRYGLIDMDGERGPELVGAAILSDPVQYGVLTKVFPELRPHAESLELGRFVLDDEVPANGESWFLAEVFREAFRKGIQGVVSFSDPVRRQTAAGRVILPGHVGIIYQATNADYLGRATPRTLAVLPGGVVLSAKAMQKIRKQEQGHGYAERLLVDAGARAMRAGEKPASWLAEALNDAHARRFRHRGVHRYAFRLAPNRSWRETVRLGLPSQSYPKSIDPGVLEVAA